MTAFSAKSHSSYHRRRNMHSLWASCFRYSLVVYILWQSIHILIRIFDEPIPTTNVIEQNILTTPNVVHRSRKAAVLQQRLPPTPDDFEVNAKTVTKEQPTAKIPPKGSSNELPHHGTGPAKEGFIVDCVAERARAPFRDILIPDNHEKVQSLLHEALENADANAHYEVCETPSECRGRTAVAVYNPAPFSRYIEDTEIAPHSAHPLESTVGSQLARVLPKDTSKAQPIQVYPYDRREDFAHLQYTTIDGCSTPCQVASTLNIDDSSRRGITELAITQDHWKIIHSNDDPYANPHAKREPTAYQSHIYYATRSWKSAIPITFFDPPLDDALWDSTTNAPLDYDTLPARAVYLVNDACSSARRNKWQAAVAAVLPVAAYGACDHNTPLPAGGTLSTAPGRVALYRTGRIALVLEAGMENDSITRQVWEALAAGVVPAIYGALNVADRIPRGSAIVHAPFGTNWDGFAAKVKKVAEDQALWESYHAWRSDAAELQRMRDMYAFSHIPVSCRLCSWARAKQHGLEWNHQKQEIMDKEEKRTLCAESDKLVSAPFVEAYEGFTDIASSSCSSGQSLDSTSSSAKIGSHIIRRVETPHIGVTDFMWEGSGATETTALTLSFPSIHNLHGASFRHPHSRARGALRIPLVSSIAIQDTHTRATILVDGIMDLGSPSPGKVRIPHLPTRLRVVVESLDGVQDKQTEFFPTPFGERVMLDFVDPLQFYTVAAS